MSQTRLSPKQSKTLNLHSLFVIYLVLSIVIAAGVTYMNSALNQDVQDNADKQGVQRTYIVEDGHKGQTTSIEVPDEYDNATDALQTSSGKNSYQPAIVNPEKSTEDTPAPKPQSAIRDTIPNADAAVSTPSTMTFTNAE